MIWISDDNTDINSTTKTTLFVYSDNARYCYQHCLLRRSIRIMFEMLAVVPPCPPRQTVRIRMRTVFLRDALALASLSTRFDNRKSGGAIFVGDALEAPGVVSQSPPREQERGSATGPTHVHDFPTQATHVYMFMYIHRYYTYTYICMNV